MNFNWLLPTVKGIPVLMYHKVEPDQADGLTIDLHLFKKQLKYLKGKGYSAVTLSDFILMAKGIKKRREKSILLTFDDGYKNNLVHVYPLLQKYNWPATIFISADLLDDTHPKQIHINDTKMSIDELKSLDTHTFQIALHGYQHENFKAQSLEQLKTIMRKSFELFELNEIPHFRVLAYPFGAMPKTDFKAFKIWMQKHQVSAAFRIGNKPAKIPSKDLYEIKRIDIKGTDTFEEFKIKLKKGKLNPF